MPPEIIENIKAYLGLGNSSSKTESARRLLKSNAETVGYSKNSSILDNNFSIVVFGIVVLIGMLALTILYLIKY